MARIAACIPGLLKVSHRICNKRPGGSEELPWEKMVLLRSNRNQCRRCDVWTPTSPGRNLTALVAWQTPLCCGFTIHMVLLLPHTYHDFSYLSLWINGGYQAQLLWPSTETPLFMPEPTLRESTVIPASSRHLHLLHTRSWRRSMNEEVMASGEPFIAEILRWSQRLRMTSPLPTWAISSPEPCFFLPLDTHICSPVTSHSIPNLTPCGSCCIPASW